MSINTITANESVLDFSTATPVASCGLGGLSRDQFANGRLFATVGAHGGLLDISYCGNQKLGAFSFFHGDAGTAWTKLFRSCVGLGADRYYLPLNNTSLYPFGYASSADLAGVQWQHQLLLLPDALVQRFKASDNPEKLPVFIEMFHQEMFVETKGANRTRSPFEFDPSANALITCCIDENPEIYRGGDSIYQKTLGLEVKDAPYAETWIGLGCSTPMTAKFVKKHASNKHFKIYLTSTPVSGNDVSFFLVFAASRGELVARLQALSKNVGSECDDLLDSYEKRLRSRPQIDVGDKLLNSAFAQFPEIVHHMKLPDRPGATRGSFGGYFVWGWDGLTPAISSALANEPEYTAAMLRFFQETMHPQLGIAHTFTTSFQLKAAWVFPAQAFYIASLYHYVSTTGDLALVKEVMPTCKFIIDRCREKTVGDTGLAAGTGFWPDFPKFLDETGRDLNSVNNSLLYQGLRCMEYLASVAGDAAFSRDCGEWAGRLRKNFIKYLYDEEKGYFFSSCSADDFSPRKHYPVQAFGLWVTPFARELISHDPVRIAEFMNRHLRSAKCLLSLPRWDTAWMRDGNQLGASFPVADYAYLQVNKIVGNDSALNAWMEDVKYFWSFHTAPEAFTPEALNQDEFGPDNTGGKQAQSVTSWYACAYMGLAGMDFDHEGVTFTPWGDRPVDIRGLILHGVSVDLSIRGSGHHIGTLMLDGKIHPSASLKINWAELAGERATIELVRTEKTPDHPVIVRADGLRVEATSAPHKLTARITGDMGGELVIQTSSRPKILVDGVENTFPFDASTGTITIPYKGDCDLDIAVEQ
ncbi:MAG: hypothetical protein WC637_14560 [Victivallales bacterium]|jgi:hypothetical protein